MLQQTRVETVIPYYRRFMERYPRAEAFAQADEREVLTMWAGLGYYSRARNLWRAAQSIAEAGKFPRGLENIRELPGVGSYTAAAVASIAFDNPVGVLDGNVARVLARLMNVEEDVKSPKARRLLEQVANRLAGGERAGDYNQAVMELGALVCVPRAPKCNECPVTAHCVSRKLGLERERPVLTPRPVKVFTETTLLAVIRNDELLLRQRPADSARLAGFWELPELMTTPGARPGKELGRFRHTIVNQVFTCIVRSATLDEGHVAFRWWRLDRLDEIPLSTAAKKAVLCL